MILSSNNPPPHVHMILFTYTCTPVPYNRCTSSNMSHYRYALATRFTARPSLTTCLPSTPRNSTSIPFTRPNDPLTLTSPVTSGQGDPKNLRMANRRARLRNCCCFTGAAIFTGDTERACGIEHDGKVAVRHAWTIRCGGRHLTTE